VIVLQLAIVRQFGAELVEDHQQGDDPEEPEVGKQAEEGGNHFHRGPTDSTPETVPQL
jgi:hypothetical protein